ncbi:Rhodanese-like domain-containing protein [Phycomyces nitens]|nr:Rhodanese-like domain-containing protein [Phycomyces nitens]
MNRLTIGVFRAQSSIRPVWSPIRFHSILASTPRFRPVAFYTIVPLSQDRIRELQSEIHSQLKKYNVLGRIYLAPEQGIGGINCQMAVPLGQLDTVKDFFQGIREFTQTGPIAFTEGIQDTLTPSFRNLRVAIKRNLVATKAVLQTKDLALQPDYLDPAVWHEQLADKGNKAFVLDMRNHYEYDIGHFEHAIKMDVDTFRDGLEVMDSLLETKPTDQDIYMYCTGGIRCSVAGSYLLQKGYKGVKMLKGGVSAYGHYVQKENKPSLFRGMNFTFDGRRGERITADVLSNCFHCNAPCDRLSNCSNTLCHLLFTQCDACQAKMDKTCSTKCKETIEGKVDWTDEYNYHNQIRPIAQKSTA